MVREKEIDAREKQMEQDRQKVGNDMIAAHGNETSPTDVLHLNIGGTKTTVFRRTLTSIPGSMLASKFSGRWDDSIEKDKDGNFFIEQDYALFRHVLTFLRNKANGEEKYPVESPRLDEETETYTDLVRMLDYYGLTDEMFPVTLNLHPLDASLRELNSRKVNAEEWGSFLIDAKGHFLRIKTFEVTLGIVQQVQIGWSFANTKLCFHKHYCGEMARNKDTIGIGDIKETCALDLTRSSYLSSGEATPIDLLGLEQIEGSVVRSENFGQKWYVNGKLVKKLPPQDYDWSKKENIHAFISVAGEIEVTSVEFDI